ncbi:hypothetical protein BD809_10149 [Aquimarina intermedia]|uniref:Uncharacterized protein n=1 Tax=Aquimarina intermedia TaxID=350814 RepID=A0A5S5CC11_9FLAO|nr:hypothetical protein BD809_10149 [Aquimarina intermedia]
MLSLRVLYGLGIIHVAKSIRVFSTFVIEQFTK